MHSEVHHPDFAGIPEITALLRKRSKSGLPGLLMPNRSTLSRWGESDPQVLLVPLPQCFGIMSPEKESADSGYSFLFRPRFLFDRCLGSRSGTCRLSGGL